MALVQSLFPVYIGNPQTNSSLVGIAGELAFTTIPSGSAVSLTTATSANVATLALTPGEWDVSGAIDYVLTGVTGTLFKSGISLTTATLPTQAGGSGLGPEALAAIPLITTTVSGTFQHVVPVVKLVITIATTIYLVANETFSAGTATAYGTIRARRIK